MALTPPKRPQPGSHKEPLDDFNWPPSDEELGFAWPPTDDELAQNSPFATSAVPPATSAVPLVVPARVDAPALAHENPPMPAESKRASADRESVVFNASVSDLPAPGSSEFLRPAAPDDARNETRLKQSDVDESRHSGTANPTTAAIAIAEREMEQQGFAAGIAAEIAHLQALIDEFTRRVDQHITIVTDGETRQTRSQFL